jgi:predicted amidohydrolase
MTLTDFALKELKIAENAKDSETLERVRILSEQFNIGIIYGACIILEGNKKPSNVLYYSTPGKQSVILYSKCHLFSYAGEDQYMMPGNEPCIINLS